MKRLLTLAMYRLFYLVCVPPLNLPKLGLSVLFQYLVFFLLWEKVLGLMVLELN